MLQSLIKSKTLGILLILVVCLVEYVFLLGFPRIFQVSEGREGVVVNSILETGNYILPLRHAELIPSKPPLFHWITSFIVELTSKFDEFELRLTSAISAIALVLYFYFFCLNFFGNTFALFSSLILLTNYGFGQMATDARVDMLFCFFSTVPILFWIKSYYQHISEHNEIESFPKKVYTIIAILIGFSILTKGPLGAVLPIAVISPALFYFQGVRGLKSLINYRWGYILIVACPWYIVAAFSGKDAFIQRQLVFENISRFFGAEGITIKPWWFYLQHFWSQAFPWSLVIFVIIYNQISRLIRLRLLKNENAAPSYLASPAEDFIIKVSTIWAILIFVFLSFAAGKRSSYLLLIAIPVNLIVSLYLYRIRSVFNIFAEGKDVLAKKVYKASLLLWSLVLILPVVFVLIAVTGSYKIFPLKELALVFEATAIALQGWGEILLAYYLIFLVLGLLSLFWSYQKKNTLLFIGSVFLFFIYCFSFLSNSGMAIRGVTHSYKSFAKEISSLVPAPEKLTFIKKKKDESFDGFFFYFKRTVYLFEPSGREDENSVPSEAGLYLARKMWLDEQAETFSSRIETIKIGGRMVDQDQEDKNVVLFRLR